MNILEEADEITQGDRRKDYGSPKIFYQRLALLWGVILNTPVTPHQVALCMVALKLARELNGHKRDSIVDIAGYARTIEMLMDEDVDK